MNSKTQNYRNHARLVPSFHYLTLGGILVSVIAGFFLFCQNMSCGWLLPGLLILNAVLLASVALHSRSFGLKAQDRAIRAEESLRYFILTGKRMSDKLTIGQIVALRFSSDEEFVALAQEAVEKKLSNREIKLKIRNWRPDYHRV